MGNLPSHSIPGKEDIVIESIDYPNPYDYTEKHRHEYFEILLFEKGGGSQLIDFEETEVKDKSVYIVFPNQIHLLRRTADAHGALIQFRARNVDLALSQKLNEFRWTWKGMISVENEQIFALCKRYLQLMDEAIDQGEVLHYLLQGMLCQLMNISSPGHENNDASSDIYSFTSLLEQHFCEQHSVSFYQGRLGFGEKKLRTICKEYKGSTPLQVIHARVLLEAKRLLLFADRTHKEIAYELGFDNPAAFSGFIKKKTGMTATELQSSVTEIHK